MSGLMSMGGDGVPIPPIVLSLGPKVLQVGTKKLWKWNKKRRAKKKARKAAQAEGGRANEGKHTPGSN